MSSSTVRVTTEVEWIIDIITTGCKKVGDYLKSEIFTTANTNGNIEWYMIFYPKGRYAEIKDYTSIYLLASKETTANVTFELINNNKSEKHSIYKLGKQKFNKAGYGYKEFVSRNYIYDLKNGIFKDDKITVICKITIDEKENKVDEITENEEIKRKLEVVERLSELNKYEILINNEKFSDMLLVSEDKTIKVHKCILAKSSPVFDAMFDADMEEKQKHIVKITDIKHDILLEMVRFIYTGKVNNIDEIAYELVAAAEKYALDGLKEVCEEVMCKNLSTVNVVSYLKHAEKYRMVKLKKEGIEFIIANADEVSNQEEFKLLPSALLCEIFRTSMLNL